MKNILFLFLIFTFNLNAQDFAFINIDSLIQVAKKDSIRKDSIKQMHLADRWDTQSFNPYKHSTLEFPIHIEFDENQYASPILKDNVITSRFGWRWGRPHRGIDVDLITGDEVTAMLEGKVRYVGYHSGHGRTVIVRHYNGLETAYTHLSRYSVVANEIVGKGQVIGKGGASGNARGSHVHIEVSYKGYKINPEYLFSFDSDRKIKRQEFWITKDLVTPHLHNSRRQSDFVYFKNKEEAINSLSIQQRFYVVKPGDTLYDIARKYNVSISKICKANAISRNSTLRVGQELVI